LTKVGDGPSQTESSAQTTAECATATPNTSTTNIPRYGASKTSQKPGPAPLKNKSNRSPKGSSDPITVYNKFGSLDDMDLEINLSPGKGSNKNKKK
jgi:hypothetical protein